MWAVESLGALGSDIGVIKTMPSGVLRIPGRMRLIRMTVMIIAMRGLVIIPMVAVSIVVAVMPMIIMIVPPVMIRESGITVEPAWRNRLGVILKAGRRIIIRRPAVVAALDDISATVAPVSRGIRVVVRVIGTGIQHYHQTCG